MKTLCLTLGLLLIVFYSLGISTFPGNCCFHFRGMELPDKRVTYITKTHISCPKKGFIIHTVTGRQICFNQSSVWAQRIYTQIHNSDGSGWWK
uniref:Chemokine interleukin-8-like domain-containing protein n=1 Tax=Nothobranchius furzeri TaxID=105023 RepID=A0A8C6MEW4_NOTFU